MRGADVAVQLDRGQLVGAPASRGGPGGRGRRQGPGEPHQPGPAQKGRTAQDQPGRDRGQEVRLEGRDRERSPAMVVRDSARSPSRARKPAVTTAIRMPRQQGGYQADFEAEHGADGGDEQDHGHDPGAVVVQAEGLGGPVQREGVQDDQGDDEAGAQPEGQGAASTPGSRLDGQVGFTLLGVGGFRFGGGGAAGQLCA